ncbi:MAG: hypothetical protein IJ060_03510 [Oscillospiraceae bacterium]|nr:hypothetical protein [Oscillospiraceae bacterium]
MQWMTEETGWLLPEAALSGSEMLQPERLLRLGAGLVQAAPACMVGCAEGGFARACAMQICSGAAAAGGDAVLIPECTIGELGTSSLHTPCGVLAYCADNGLRLFSRGLLPLTAAQEQTVLNGGTEPGMLRGSEYGNITDGSALRQYYVNRLKARLPEHMPARVHAETAQHRLQSLLSPLLRGGRGDVLTLQISADGCRASVYSEKHGWIFYEKLLLMVALAYLEQGEDAALPYWLPQTAGALGSRFGRRVLRFAPHPDGGDTEARALAVRQGFALDGALLCADFLRFHAERYRDLQRWADAIPPCHTIRRVLSASRARDAAERCARSMQIRKTPEGIRAEDARGTALLHPARSGKTAALLIEAANMELAQELAAELTPPLSGE